MDGTNKRSRTPVRTRLQGLLIGWFNLSKPSRNRQQKRGWKRSPRGRIDPTMAAQLAMLAVVFLLFVGGVSA